LLERILPLFKAVIYHSRVYQDYAFAERKGLLGNAVVIPNGADPEAFQPRDEQEPLNRPIQLLTVGSHVRSKGHRDFIDACRLLKLGGTIVSGRPAKFTEALRGCYLACLVSSQLKHVCLSEGGQSGVVNRAMTDSDIFFLPSTVECSPLVIFEAMASGIPWVAYPVGNLEEVSGGIVVANMAEAVDAIGELAADHYRREQLGQEGRQAILDWHSWSDILPRYGKLILAVPPSRPE
jgi:glycosyltransferase involved in cell wall biosynthesis